MMDIADILTSVAAVIMSSALFVIAVKGFRRLEAKVGSVHVVAEQVNAAVNNVEPGQPTLRSVVERIQDELCEHITDTNKRLTLIEEHLTAATPKKKARPKGEYE